MTAVPNGDLYEVFDHYNVPLGADGTPYEYFEALRDQAVGTKTFVGWSHQQGGFWVVTGWDEAREIMHDPETFSNEEVVFPPFQTPGDRRMMLSSYDDPEHRRYRQLVQTPFSPRSVAALSDRLKLDAHALLDSFADRRAIDAATDMAQIIPGRMIALMLGLPPEEGTRYATWVEAMTQPLRFLEPEWAARQVAELHESFGEILAERRRKPGEDALSFLIAATGEGAPLTDEELEDFFVVMLVGGIENTGRLLANMFWRLGWDRELRRRLIHNRSKLPLAIDEFLRYYSPGIAGRLVTKDVSIGKSELKKGDQVVLFHAIINRDPRQFPYPDAFVPDRENNRHFALGLGLHRCLGMHLLRMEALATFDVVLQRMPGWELDPDNPSRWVSGQTGGMNRVPILITERA